MHCTPAYHPYSIKQKQNSVCVLILWLHYRENNNEDTLRRLSALSPYQLAELCEQANTVAVHFQMAADDQRTAEQSSTAVAAEEANETLHQIEFPESMQTGDLENSPDSHPAVTLVVTEADVGEASIAKSLQLKSRGKDTSVVKKSFAASVKENKKPTPTVVSPAGRKTSSAVTTASA